MTKEELLKQLPLSWQGDFDLDSLEQRDDGRFYLRHRGGIMVPIVIRDGYPTCDAPVEVLEEIRRCFPDSAAEIIPQLRYHSGLWSFTRWGMFVGIDLMSDGSVYIHS